ncbi:hypothetical protein ACT3SZ_10300 [Corynebacterium sp. AOP40-9SA-29]|uniref:hypothetical protein n=1 Tax=Corynebacterium sp. AOP40-9SA-29 TaxID=3457677 RepID=UPI0040346B7D
MFSRDGRKRPTPRRVVDPEAPDAMFPHLPRHRADLLREETMRRLHAEGYDTSWRPDGYIAATPATEPGSNPEKGPEKDPEKEPDTPPARRLIGLDNLSLQIAAAPKATPAQVVEMIHHFLGTVLTDIDVDGLGEAEFLRQLRVRLVSRSALDAASGSVDDSSREFSGDLLVSLVLDTPDAVVTLNDDSLAAHGTATREQLSDLYQVGYRNTWQELLDADVEVNEVRAEDREESPAAHFHVVESDSYFLASAPLFLDELLPRWLPELDASAGVMVTVPHRHLMLVREVTTGQDLLDGINTMTSVALGQMAANPGPLTARLHLAHDGEFRVFTNVTTSEDGEQVLQVEPNDYLMSRLESEGPE